MTECRVFVRLVGWGVGRGVDRSCRGFVGCRVGCSMGAWGMAGMGRVFC